MSGALQRSLHKADTRARPCTCKLTSESSNHHAGTCHRGTQRHASARGGLQPHAAQSAPRGTTLHKAAAWHNAMLAADASHTPHKAPEGHNTRQGKKTLDKASTWHNAMRAAGVSVTPHKAPRGAKHYTRLHGNAMLAAGVSHAPHKTPDHQGMPPAIQSNQNWTRDHVR